MAISFKNIKSTVLDMTDKITSGKLQGCRVCDVIPDHYEYLIWADKQGFLKFTKLVIETIQEHAGYKAQQRHYDEEIAPYLKESVDMVKTTYEVFEDDVPF